MKTKEEYLEAIEQQIQRRREAITAMAEITKTNYTEMALLEQAQIAANAFHQTRTLRAEMKNAFPTQCTCACDQHRQETK